MNDEIKEMLELHIKNDIDLLPKNQKTVLDYITNLQQENERLKDQNINEILKKDLEICAKQYKKSEEKLEKYKSRCEKAVEYKHNWQNVEENETIVFDNNKLMDFFNKMEKILNGRSDE